MSMYYMFSIQLTNCIWCLSHLFLLLLQSTTNQPNTPPAVNVRAVRILLECILVIYCSALDFYWHQYFQCMIWIFGANVKEHVGRIFLTV